MILVCSNHLHTEVYFFLKEALYNVDSTDQLSTYSIVLVLPPLSLLACLLLASGDCGV